LAAFAIAFYNTFFDSSPALAYSVPVTENKVVGVTWASLRTYPKSRFKRFETTDVDAKRLAEGYTDEHRLIGNFDNAPHSFP
jgi:hypothetical protein